MKSLQLFEASPDTTYTIDTMACLSGVPRDTILIYCSSQLLEPTMDSCGVRFNNEAVRALQRIEYLRRRYGLNLAGIKMTLGLMAEVDRLQSENRLLRQ